MKDSNEYLTSKNKPPLTQDVISMIETQVLSIKEPDHKIRTLVGNFFICFKVIIKVYFLSPLLLPRYTTKISDIERWVSRQ